MVDRVQGRERRSACRDAGLSDLRGGSDAALRCRGSMVCAIGREGGKNSPHSRSGRGEGVAIAEFPSLAEAKQWYESPGYQAAAQHRFKGATYRGLIVEGI